MPNSVPFYLVRECDTLLSILLTLGLKTVVFIVFIFYTEGYLDVLEANPLVLFVEY